MDDSSDKELERYIQKQVTFEKLPASVKVLVENSKAKWKQYVIRYSIRHQLRWKTNIIHTVVPDEKNYYQEIIRISRLNFMLYPYHISDVLVRNLRVTTFQYYLEMMLEVMASEKSYDALPNFTAADCVRVLDIGRNQFIDIMNKCRAKASLFKNKKKVIRSMLPNRAVDSEIDYWWTMHLGFITEEDIKNSNELEHKTIDAMIEKIDRGDPPARAGEWDLTTVKSLSSRGLIYLMVPIANEDQISVPPLEGFVMNRVLGDYFENLLYKIFVSVDERTTIEQLAEVLQIDVELVKHAVSVYIRLGFAKKKNVDPLIKSEQGDSKWHPSWFNKGPATAQSEQATETKEVATESSADAFSRIDGTVPGRKRIGFVFDSSLTAFLMMGNLGPGLKSHAVTMFEVGKLADEMLDDFMTELDKVKIDEIGEGEARRYADHALTLAQVLKFLRRNPNLQVPDSDGGVDLLRCERMNSLEEATRLRIINKNYAVMISMAPIAAEANPVTSCIPPNFGPTISEVNSVWFKLFLYNSVGSGVTSMLIPKGTRIKMIPDLFKDYERVSISAWDHDTFTQGTYHALPILNDYLLTSPILIQALCYTTPANFHPTFGKINRAKYVPPTIDVPFPLDDSDSDAPLLEADDYNESNIHTHPTVRKIESVLGLQYSCGFIRMQKTEAFKNIKSEWVPLDVYFGIPIFSPKLNQQVLERIEKKQLFMEENLRNQSKNSRKLSLRLLDFIANHIQVQDLTKFDRTPTESSHVDIGSVVPLPTHPIIFCQGVLS